MVFKVKRNRSQAGKKGWSPTPFFKFPKLFSDLLLEVENVREKSHVAGALYGLSYLLLVLEGNVRVLTRNDLVELGNELLEEFGIFVVDRLDTCLVDRANGLSHVGCRLSGN